MDHATVEEQPEPRSTEMPEGAPAGTDEAAPADCAAAATRREKMTFRFPSGSGARMARLCAEWGFASNTQLIEVAVAYLDQQTQRGLRRLDGLVMDGN